MTAALPASLFVLNRSLWLMAAVLVAVCWLWLMAEGIALDFSGAMTFFYIAFLFFGIAAFYRYIRRDDAICLLAQLANQWLAVVAAIGMLSYVSARLNFPLTDGILIEADRALGFDWKQYVAWVDARPWLATVMTYAYLSSGPQIMAVILLLFLCRRLGHAQRFLVAFTVTALATVILAALLPAVGAYVYYDIDAASYFRHIQPAAPRVHEAPLMAMRDGSLTTLVFPLQGLVTFPSFHSALSIVLIYAAWPIIWARAISLPLNILVLFSTPGDGGHYLTDILGGVVIALIVIAFLTHPFGKRGGDGNAAGL